ncbi:MAG: tetratricopeptide repeat protein [Saprospiraceae bacterium]
MLRGNLVEGVKMMQLLELDKLDTLEKVARQQLSIDAEDGYALHYLCQSLLEQERFKEGEEVLKQLMHCAPNSLESIQHTITIAWSKKDFPAAKQACLSYLEQAPDDPQVSLMYMRCLMFLGDTTEAGEVIKRLLSEHPNDPEIRNAFELYSLAAHQQDISQEFYSREELIENQRAAETYIDALVETKHEFKKAKEEALGLLSAHPNSRDLRESAVLATGLCYFPLGILFKIYLWTSKPITTNVVKKSLVIIIALCAFVNLLALSAFSEKDFQTTLMIHSLFALLTLPAWSKIIAVLIGSMKNKDLVREPEVSLRRKVLELIFWLSIIVTLTIWRQSYFFLHLAFLCYATSTWINATYTFSSIFDGVTAKSELPEDQFYLVGRSIFGIVAIVYFILAFFSKIAFLIIFLIILHYVGKFYEIAALKKMKVPMEAIRSTGKK